MNNDSLTDWTGFSFESLNGAPALVTGGAGFIGSHLAAALSSLKADVIVLDDLSGGGNPAQLSPDVKFVRGSILDQKLLADCTAGCRFVFHQAALGSVPKSVEQPRAFAEVNITGTLNVLEAARSAGVQRVMFAASSSAYGDSPELPKHEAMPTDARSPYAASKVAGESLLAAWSASYGLDTVSLRYFNIFGPRQNANSAYAAVIAAFAKSILNGQRPRIFGDGKQSRDFTYVDNAVYANLLAATHAKALNGSVINVACGERVTVNELARELASQLGRPELEPEYREERAGDVKHSLADLTRAKAILGYHPIVTFKQGLNATAKWYHQEYIAVAG